MIVEFNLVFTKTQFKANDCWYACIQMIRSAVAGARTAVAGQTAATHRSPILGQKLSFESPVGAQIIRDNGLRDVANQIKLNKMDMLARCMQTYGPLIVGGKFAVMNSQGHFIVISGCNTDAGQVSVYDPGWGKGRDTKPWSDITAHIWKVPGSDVDPAAGSVIADDPTAFFNQATRARR